MINAQGITEINNFIEKCKDPSLQESLRAFINQEIQELYSSDRTRATKLNYVNALREVVKRISSFQSFKEVSWSKFCLFMQHYRVIDICEKKPYKKYLSACYLFLLNAVPQELCLIDVQMLKTIISVEERPLRNSSYMNKFILQHIYTNFPINSAVDQIYFIDELGEDRLSTNINLHTSDTFIKKLLIAYINWLNPRLNQPQVLIITYRIFVYYFAESFSLNSKPQCISDISFDLYKTQYDFYKALNEECSITGTLTLTGILKGFYIFLIDYIEANGIEHNVFSGTSIDRDMLVKDNFSSWLDEGYIFTNKTGMDDVPEGDKWLLPDDSNACANKTPQGFDFTSLQNRKHIINLKKWVWTVPNLVTQITCSYFRYIVDFLNLKHSYDADAFWGSEKYQSEEFDPGFMLFYKLTIEKKFPNKGTRENVFKAVKNFLNFHKETYKVSDVALSYLTFKNPPPKENVVMDVDDWSSFAEEFKRKSVKSCEDELYFIIFNLKSTTHLRIGEILNLDRNYLLEVNDKGPKPNGVIQYYSKKSKGKLVKRTLRMDKIMLIERAKYITEKLAQMFNGKAKNYVFIRIEDYRKFSNTYGTTKIARISGADFNEAFEEVQISVIGNAKYTAYDLRHIFKDTIWKEGPRAGLSILELERIVDSKYSTDRKYYRSQESLLMYVEGFAGTSVTGVNAEGDFIKDEIEICQLNPVEDGIGACNKEQCEPQISGWASEIVDILETEDMCLICSCFKTCTSRLPLFAGKIKNINRMLDNNVEGFEKDVLIARRQVYSFYYKELLLYQEGERKNGDTY